MTISSTPRKAGPFIGTGIQTAWPFAFKVFAASDVKVTIADAEGTETVLVLNTDYSVTLNPNQETSPGGTVTYPISGSPLPAGGRLTVTGDIPYDQTLDIPSGGNFSPLALENQLDRTTMQVQQLAEEVERAVKVPVTEGEGGQLSADLAQGILRLADSADNIDTVANNLPAISTVADNVADVNTVASNIGNVAATGANIAAVVTVANDLNEPVSEIDTVATNIADVNTVGQGIGAVNTVAANIADVNTVATNIADVQTVADNVADVTNFADVYYGPRASDPTTRNDGSPPQLGDLYFNTGSKRQRTFDGAAWVEGSTIPGTYTVDVFSGDGTETAFPLSVDPVSKNNTQVFIGGVYQQKSQYDVAGGVITFATAPPAGTNNVEVATTTTASMGTVDSAFVPFASTTVKDALHKAALFYPDYAAASAAAATLPDGQVVSTDDPPASYSVSEGGLLERRSNRKLVNIAEWISPVMVDITEAVRAAHVFANLYGLPVSYAGLPLIRIQANAQIPIKTNVDFCGAELEILDGYVPVPSWSTFNTVFIVSDDACPLISVTGSVLASNLSQGSLYPTLGIFNGHGYAKITCGFQVPNRLKTGTQNYTQSFKVNRNGRASLPLSADLSAYASSIQVEYRNTSKSKLVIKNLSLSEGAWNNQRVFDIHRCNTTLDIFTLLHNNQSFNNICEVVNISDASDVVINDYVTTGRVITESEGSYSLSINGGADIRVNRMNSLEGWGSTGINNVNGLYFSDSTVNRIDGHDSAHNIFTDNCDVHHYGITYGWGGGVISAKNSRFHRCTPIQNRSDWGGTFFGAIIVDGIEVENNFSAGVTIVDLESTPLGATTPVIAPSVISVSNVVRTGGAPSAGGEIIAARVKAASAESIVYAPTTISCANISSTLPRWRFGIRVDLLNMEGVAPNLSTCITVDGVHADYAAGSAGNVPTTGILDFDQVRTPSSPVRPKIRFSNCDNVAVLCRSAANVDIRGFDSGINALAVNNTSAQKPLVVLDACRFLTLPIGATASQIGASNSGYDRYTVVRNSEIANFAFDFSMVAAMTGNTIRQGGVPPTLPSGCTPELAFSGWRKSGVFA